MTPEELEALRHLAFSNAKAIQALSARGKSQQDQLDDLLVALRLIGEARNLEESRQELDRDLRSLFQEMLSEMRAKNVEDSES